jgi:hypothetical protein
MKRSVFDTTTIQDVLRFAGYAVTSDIRKLMKCPLHKDDSPSFRAFERGYCCFGCGAKGGIADWARQLLAQKPRAGLSGTYGDFVGLHEG